MIRICIRHNMVDHGSGWESSVVDVMDLAKKMKRPATISPSCHECQKEEKVKKDFLIDSTGGS